MTPLMKCVTVINRCANLFRANKLEGTGLTCFQNSYISNLCRNPGISQDQLAKILYIPKCNVSRQLAALEQTGFVTRKRSETDARVLLVYPTQKAYDVEPQIYQMLGEWNDYLTSDFSSEEKELLNRMIERVMEKATRYASENLDRKKER